MYSLLTLLSSLAAVVAAPTVRQAPFEVTAQAPWNSGAVTTWQIHSSCNASARYQLAAALDEAAQLASHAKAHINRWGNESAIYRKYFGDRPVVETVGALDIIVNGDRHEALFRCDDPDSNCANFPSWAGHWRGSNATDETVICPRSFEIRLPLASVCARGWNVRQGEKAAFWASDLVHRLWHMPAFGQGYVDHFAESYDETLEAAANNSPNSTRDSYGLIYFALESWAYDIIAPGTGCPGPAGKLAEESSFLSIVPSATSTSSVVASASAQSCNTRPNGDVHCREATATAPSAPSATVASAEASSTGGAGANCHTHKNGELHCT